jgi:hypothetical protein
MTHRVWWYHARTWLPGCRTLVRGLATSPSKSASDVPTRYPAPTERCRTVNLRTCINRLWTVDLEILVRLSSKDENPTFPFESNQGFSREPKLSFWWIQ